MKRISIFRYTIAILSLMMIFIGFLGGNEILKLKEENRQLKKQVRYLELSREYKPILEKSEKVRNSQNDTSFARQVNANIYLYCRRLENIKNIFETTVDAKLAKHRILFLKIFSVYQLFRFWQKVVIADLDGSLNL